jgi:UDP-N-acetylglucosamine transferase subunit ALG13
MRSSVVGGQTDPGPGGTVFVTVGSTKFDELIAAADDPAFADALRARGYNRLLLQVDRRTRPRAARLHRPPGGQPLDAGPSAGRQTRRAGGPSTQILLQVDRHAGRAAPRRIAAAAMP